MTEDEMVGWHHRINGHGFGCHTRGYLNSLSYLVRNPTLAPQLEKTHETPPSSRDEGLLFLHGLESNPESSLQTVHLGPGALGAARC